MTIYAATIYQNIMLAKGDDHQKRENIHSYNTRGKETLVTPYNRLKTTDCVHNSIRYLNKLSTGINKKKGTAFQKVLKRNLIEKAYYNLEEFTSQ